MFKHENRQIQSHPAGREHKVGNQGNTGSGCPLITRMNTNEYFAVSLILCSKIKFTASASVLLVTISAIRG